MVQFLSIKFFCWISSIFLGFSKVPVFLCHPVLMYRKGAFVNVMSEQFNSVNMHGINTVKIGVSDFFRCRVCHLSVALGTQESIHYANCWILLTNDFDKHQFSFDIGVLWFCRILIVTFLLCVLFICWWHSVHHIVCRIINQSDSLWLVTGWRHGDKAQDN
jgi:hypothetical protein